MHIICSKNWQGRQAGRAQAAQATKSTVLRTLGIQYSTGRVGCSRSLATLSYLAYRVQPRSQLPPQGRTIPGTTIYSLPRRFEHRCQKLTHCHGDNHTSSRRSLQRHTDRKAPQRLLTTSQARVQQIQGHGRTNNQGSSKTRRTKHQRVMSDISFISLSRTVTVFVVFDCITATPCFD